MVGPMEAERLLEMQRPAEETQALSPTVGETAPDKTPVPIVRGFGKEYRDFPDEMQTDIDAEGLATHMKTLGIEVRYFPAAMHHSSSYISVVYRTCAPASMPAITSATISTTAR
jgi:hypothetical protein